MKTVVGKKNVLRFVAISLLVFFLAACSQPLLTKGGDGSFDPACNVDDTVSPGDDFFQYACGSWIKSHPVSEDGSAQQPIEDIQWLKQVYDSGLDEAFRKIRKLNDEFTPKSETALVRSLMEEIDKIATMDDAIDEIAKLGKMGIQTIFNVNNSIAFYDGHLVPCFGADLLTLLVINFIDGEIDQFVEMRNNLKDYLKAVDPARESQFEVMCSNAKELAGIINPSNASGPGNWRNAERKRCGIGQNEGLYLSVMSSNNIASVSVLYRIMRKYGYKDEMISMIPIDDMSLGVIEKFDELTDASVEKVKDLIRFCILSFFIYRDTDLYEGADSIDSMVSYARLRYNASVLYANKYGLTQQNEVMGLLEDIRKTLDARLRDNSWLDSKTIEYARYKLSEMKFYVGSPSSWDDSYLIKPNKNWTSIVRACMDAAAQYEANIHRIIDNLDENGVFFMAYGGIMGAYELNAFALLENNSIFIVPRAYNSYWFDSGRDMSYNYGMLGVVLGHEITHHFDSAGSGHDADGKLHNWWTQPSKKNFDNKCEQMKAFYNKIPIGTGSIPGEFCDGEKCLGENIADFGGVALAYQAMMDYYKGVRDDLLRKREREFFIGAGNLFCSNIPDKLLCDMKEMDVHSPNPNRINAVLANFDQWYDYFDIDSSAKMYVKPEDRIVVW